MKWNLDSVHLEILLTLAQDRCTVWGKHTTWKSFWAHLMEPLGDLGQIEACFGLFRLLTQDRGTVCAQCAIGSKIVLGTQWNFQVTWVKGNHASIHLETVLISAQDRSTVCTECAIGSEIILGAPNRTSR
jgi:hypothetical protein